MPRFFIEHVDTESKSIVITGRDAEHIKVLRMRQGEALTVCNGKGIDMHCTLTASDGKTAYADVVEVTPSRSEASVKVRIYAGLAKGDRVDYVAQKCTEMGAEEIVFFNCDRCVVRLDPKKGADKKIERLQRIAEEADMARNAGFAVCAMGPRILRCETAPLIPLTAILYETNNLD